MSKIKVAIVGAGNIAHCHVTAYQLLNNVDVVAVCDIDEERAKEFAIQYGIKKVYANHIDLLKEENPDVVSVCTWNSAHAAVSINSLKAGSHVLCEKPLAMNTDEANEMLAVSKKCHKVLMPGFCTRYEEGVRLFKEYTDQGNLGEIYYIKATYLRRHGNPGGWFSDKERSGGGPVIDLGVHVLDLARYISGGNAVSVSAFTKKFETPFIASNSPHFSADKTANINNVEDFAFANVRMDNNVNICFETSWNHHITSDVFQLEVYGTKGGGQIYPKVSLSGDINGVTFDTIINHSNNENRPNYDFEEEIAHFLRVVTADEVPVCSPEDGVEVMRIVDALYKSSKENQEVKIKR